MKAAVVTALSAPRESVERDIPEPGVDRVLTRLETCSRCHTEVHV